MKLDINKVRKDFPILSNNKLIYFDNASTTQKPKIVIDSLINYYSKYNANVHRGTYKIAEKATFEYEKSRNLIADFINANNNEIIFTKSATESINIISNALVKTKIKKNDEIIITEMEHHSNIIPWQAISKNFGLKIRYIPMSNDGTLELKQLPKLINHKTKLISITHMSNVLGIINPIEKIIKTAHQNNVEVLVDAAQSISHLKINVKKIDCDYLAFSGHKIMGPTGVGVLFAKKEILNNLPPLLNGGHMIKEVTMDKFTYNDIPWKFEAGTPNIAQVIGLGAAINFYNSIDYKSKNLYLKNLNKYLVEKLNEIPDLKIYPDKLDKNGPVLSFIIKNIHGYDLAKLLDLNGICIRSGHHCAQPTLKKFNLQSLNRISLYYYNTKKDIDTLYFHLKKAIEILS